MTTSGTSDFAYNRDQIIRAAGRRVGAFQAGEIPDAQTTLDFSDALNAMVKYWEGIGIHVWTETEAVLFLQPNQIQYSFGPAQTDNAALTYTATTTTVGLSAGATALTVASISNISSGDTIGVVLSSGSIFWTTVNGAPSGLTINLTSPLTGPSPSGSNVYDYTSRIVRPLRVPFARRYNIPSAIDTPMITMSRSDYRNLPNKTNTGLPTQYFYDPQLSIGYMYVWPAPIDATNVIKFTWYRPIQDFDTASDTPDLPQEWISTLVDNLAVEMAPEFGLPADQYSVLKQRADEKLGLMTTWDREPESAYFGVDFMRMNWG